MELSGRCHCGAVRVAMRLSRPPDDLRVHACQCGFCRRHGSVAVSDPEGETVFQVRSPDDLNRYTFGARTAEFLTCKHCGVYVGAVIEADEGYRSLVNVAGVGITAFSGRRPQEVFYDDETAASRIARRRANWTPSRIAVSDAPQGAQKS
ncbi:hypothetical protein [Microbaculum marinum]|uniref:CENP-V/GFA domain-containing protein n=1 Tax=Microbaculum marinum TaxID=1764581 RepID=A0AAW9RTY9_9HYPH